MGRHRPRVRDHLAVAVHTRHYVIPPALGVDIRVPQRLHVPLAGRCHRPGGDRGAGAASSWNEPATTSQTGTGCTTPGCPRCKRPHRRARGDRLPAAAGAEDMSVITEGRGSAAGRADDDVRPARRPHRSSCGTTTSSSSTSAMRPTSTSSASARASSRASRTRRSPRWSPASTWTCSGRTRSSRSWRTLAVDLGVGRRGSAAAAVDDAGGDGTPTSRQAVAGRAWEEAHAPMVQLLVRLRLLPLRQGVGREPRHPDGLHPSLRREARRGESLGAPDRGDRRPSATGSSRSTPS